MSDLAQAPIGRIFVLVVKSATALFLSYLLFFLATSYTPAIPGYQPPFSIFIIDTINLFIHEAGHFFLRPFGMFVHILGGSLVQVLLPLLLAVVVARQSWRMSWYAVFWTGESLVNVSVYIADAPFLKLKLIAQGLIHDWHWLLMDDPWLAEPLSDAVFGAGIVLSVLGLLILIGDIGIGFHEMQLERREALEKPLWAAAKAENRPE